MFFMTIFLSTERLNLRYIVQDDFGVLKTMLQDADVMYAWEYTFSDDDVQNWINKCTELYRKFNLGYFIAEDKLTGTIVGQAALMPDNINNKEYYEIGYIFKKEYWHNGYATECARALAEYAFKNLHLQGVIFEIRPSNIPSRKVAERLGAEVNGEFTKDVRGKKMLHLIYQLQCVSYS